MHAALALGIQEVTSRVKNVFSTGPVAFVGNTTSKILELLAKQKEIFYILNQIGLWQFMPAYDWLLDADSAVCNKYPFICKEVLRLTTDLMPGVDNLTRWAYYT